MSEYAVLFYGVKVAENDLFKNETVYLPNCPNQDCIYHLSGNLNQKYCPECGKSLKHTYKQALYHITETDLDENAVNVGKYRLEMEFLEDEGNLIIGMELGATDSVKDIFLTGVHMQKEYADEALKILGFTPEKHKFTLWLIQRIV